MSREHNIVQEPENGNEAEFETKTIEFTAKLNIKKHPSLEIVPISRVAFEQMLLDVMLTMRNKFVTDGNLRLLETTWNENGSTTAESSSSDSSEDEEEEEEEGQEIITQRIIHQHNENRGQASDIEQTMSNIELREE